MARTFPTQIMVPFAGSAAAAAGGVAQPGSKQQGAPVYTTDIPTIQNLAAWVNGLSGLTTSTPGAGRVPPMEEINAILKVLSYGVCSVTEQGILDWNSGITYSQYSLVQYNGVVYQSNSDANLGNTPGVSTKWNGFEAILSTGENLFRNAGMQIAQRGTSGTVTAGSPAYTLDGWIVGGLTHNVGWSQQNPAAPDFMARLKLTPSGGTPTDTFVKQRIESADINIAPTVLSIQLTVQAKIWNNTGTGFTPTLTVNYANTKDNFSAVTQLLAATNLQTCPNGGPTTVAYTFQISGLSFPNAYNGLEIIFDFGGNLSAGDIGIGKPSITVTPGAQVGLQPVVPEPQIRPIGVEMPHCQRYFYVVGGTAAFQTIGSGIEVSTTIARVLVPIPQMRVAPTITVNNPTHFAVEDSGATICTALASYYTASNQCSLQATVAAGLTTGVACFLNNNNNADATVYFSAEL